MKKIVSIALAAALAAAPVVLTACGQQGGSSNGGAAAASGVAAPFATLGDVLAEDTEGMTSTFDEQHYICAFNLDGTWWRVEADLGEGMYDQIDAVWIEDQDKLEELLSPLKVTRADVLDAATAEELEAFVGKTGADLTADGFEFAPGTLVTNGDELDCVASKGSFDYLVTFDGTVEDENTDDPAGAVAGLTVNSVQIQGASWVIFESDWEA